MCPFLSAKKNEYKELTVLLGTRLVILIPQINQAGRGESGNCSSLAGLSLWLVMTRYDLSVHPGLYSLF